MRVRLTSLVGLVVALLVGVCPPSYAQLAGPVNITAQDAGNCATANSCATFALGNGVSTAIDVSGTIGTLVFETNVTGGPGVAVDDTLWRSANFTNTVTLAIATGATAAGSFSISNNGIGRIRVRATVCAGCAVVVYQRQGYASVRLQGGTFASPGIFPAGCSPVTITFAGSTTTGYCLSAANVIDTYINGAAIVRVNNAGLTFPSDSTYPIGASGSGRPSTIFSGGEIVSGTNFKAAATSAFYFTGRSEIRSPADGQITIQDSAGTHGVGADVTADGLIWFKTRGQTDAATVKANSIAATGDIATTGSGNELRGGFVKMINDAGYLYWNTRNRIAAPSNGALRLSTADGTTGYMSLQFTGVPTCTTNCGTPGNVCLGSDSDMTCTMGTTPASGFVIAFNGTWGAAPSCTAAMALTGMVAGKLPLTVVTTTGQITIVTNGTAPVAGDKYHIHCFGIS